jgi:hypothetical protein
MAWPFKIVRRKPVEWAGAMNVGPLGVADTEPWWIVVNQIIDEAEWETVWGARRTTANTNACIAAVGAGEGVALVRQKLQEAREIALQSEVRGQRSEVRGGVDN